MTDTETMKTIAERFEKYRKQTQQASLRYYKKTYLITDDMSEEEIENIKKNIELRKEKQRKRYEEDKVYHSQKNKAYRDRRKKNKQEASV